jgi:probable HAF family extracellular repeat protein
MKTRALIYLTAMSLLATLVASSQLNGQDTPGPSHYRVIDLGTLGGTLSTGNAINNIGWVMGNSDEAGNNVQLATLWLFGLQIPLGTLGGPSSNVPYNVKNNFGLISGVSENGKHDPLNESFSCPAFGLVSGNSCEAFAWEFGVMKQLPGLGGNNSIGAADNNLGQIIGWAEDTIHDPTCDVAAGQILQFEAVVWEKNWQGKWQVRQLPPFPGDPDSAGVAINDLGQEVGISGTCDFAIGAFSAIHALLWQDGKPINLGNLGGHGWNTPNAINDRGVVVGFANGPNDIIDGALQFRFLAFLWTKQGGIQSLGTLPGIDGTLDAMSEATDINDEGQVVGVSYADFEFDGGRAFIYQNGKMTALNDLIGSASANFDISSTGGINDIGEIAAQANIVSNGVVTSEAHAVLLVPVGPEDRDAYGNAQTFVIPDDVQKEMRRHINLGHFLLPAKPL